VRLAALDLRGDLRVDLEVLSWILGFWDSVFSPKFTCFSFLLKCHLLGKLVTLAILVKPMDSSGVVGSSSERSFLAPKSRVGWFGLGSET